MKDFGANKQYETSEAARILDLPEEQIRSCVRAGILAPRRAGRKLHFSFQDLLRLKSTKALLDAGIPARRVARLMESLEGQLPEDGQLGRLTIEADGHVVVVGDGSARWEPDSGQFVFDFDAAEAERLAGPTEVERTPRPAQPSRPTQPPRPAPMGRVIALHAAPAPDDEEDDPSGGLSAEQWFDLACELEGESREEARQAYHRALELDPRLTDAHVNLGRQYHETGEVAKAESHYLAALDHAADDPVAWFNLGVLREDQRRAHEALVCYRHAVASDADYADAHYNLGLLLEHLGRRSEAMTHLMRARRLLGQA